MSFPKVASPTPRAAAVETRRHESAVPERTYANLAPAYFRRLDPRLVETFQVGTCIYCGESTAYNILRITETSDAPLKRAGLRELVFTPPRACLVHAHSPMACETKTKDSIYG
jgi:hypothetical protein